MSPICTQHGVAVISVMMPLKAGTLSWRSQALFQFCTDSHGTSGLGGLAWKWKQKYAQRLFNLSVVRRVSQRFANYFMKSAKWGDGSVSCKVQLYGILCIALYLYSCMSSVGLGICSQDRYKFTQVQRRLFCVEHKSLIIIIIEFISPKIGGTDKNLICT